MRTVYVIGYPGAGKSTAVRAALAGLLPRSNDDTLPLVEYRRPGERQAVAAQLGRIRPGGFAGTDALPMNVQPKAVQWIGGARYPLVVAEGDRLANDGFLGAASARGLLTVVLLAVSAELAAARAAERARRVGRPGQRAAWVAGRRTKVDGLAERWQALRVDGEAPADQVGAQLREAMAL